MVNESVRQQLVFEVLKALCASAGSLEMTPRSLVTRAGEITEELVTKFGGSNAS